MAYAFNDDKSKLDLNDFDRLAIAEKVANGTYEGREIASIPEIQGELERKGSVAAFLKTRSANLDDSFLHVGDYVDIRHVGIGGTRRYRIGDFWPGLETSSDIEIAPSTGIVMVSDEVWFYDVQWSTRGHNNGTEESNGTPYLASTLHEYELNTIYPSFPEEWRDRMLSRKAMIEVRFPAQGSQLIGKDNACEYNDIGKVWSPSEVEVFGQTMRGDPWFSGGNDCQFAIFRRARNRVRGRTYSMSDQYWLRTVQDQWTTDALYVTNRGQVNSHIVNDSSYHNISPLPCFLI